MGKEVAAVDKVMKEMVRPFTAIMGGSKVSSKIDIIENLLTKVDNLIIAGGMTYTFTKALGGKIGNSICEDDKLDLALELINKAKANHVNLVLAVDAKSPTISRQMPIPTSVMSIKYPMVGKVWTSVLNPKLCSPT